MREILRLVLLSVSLAPACTSGESFHASNSSRRDFAYAEFDAVARRDGDTIVVSISNARVGLRREPLAARIDSVQLAIMTGEWPVGAVQPSESADLFARGESFRVRIPSDSAVTLHELRLRVSAPKDARDKWLAFVLHSTVLGRSSLWQGDSGVGYNYVHTEPRVLRRLVPEVR